MANKDPLSLAQETLEAFFVASPCIVATLKSAVKNIDGYTKLRGTKQVDVNAESDLPALRLIPSGGPLDIHFASNAVKLDYNLQLAIKTGDLRYPAALGPLVWASYATLTRAVHRAEITGLTLAKCLPDDADSTLKNYSYIKNVSLGNAQTGFADPTDPRNRGIEGFVGVLEITLHMVFPRTFVIDWAAQTL